MRGAGRIGREPSFEIAEELGRPRFEEGLGSRLRLRLLVLVIEARRDRMMGVVRLGDEIRDRELEAVRIEPRGFVRGREFQLRAEVREDVGDMRDDDVAVAQVWRGEGRRTARLS